MASALGWSAGQIGLLSMEKRIVFVPSSNTKALKVQAGVPGRAALPWRLELETLVKLLCCYVVLFFPFIKAQQHIQQPKSGLKKHPLRSLKLIWVSSSQGWELLHDRVCVGLGKSWWKERQPLYSFSAFSA